jgi:acetyl esterase/lipase
VPALFLATALVGLAFVVNARRAVRLPPLLVPAFFGSWLTIELAPHLLVLMGAGTGVLVVRGGLGAWPGWMALAVNALSAYLLLGMVRESYRAAQILDDALTEAIGPSSTPAAAVRWREFAFPFKLWSRRIVRLRDVAYADPPGRRHRLDVWHPRDGGPGRPCLLYVPGGAWTTAITNKNHQGKPLLIEMSSRGWVCFSMNYPVSPRARFPEHIVAVKRAIAWIRENARRYGGDARFLVIAGNSAGGHLSALAALTPQDPAYQPGFEGADTSIQAAAPLYGVYDLTGAMLGELPRALRRHKRAALRYLERVVVRRRLAEDPEIFERGSPWHRVGPHAPPFFVVHGSMDSLALVEEARAFVERLRAVSSEPVAYAELPRTQHAFDQFLSIRTIHTVRAIARFAEWAYARFSAGPRAPDAGRELRSPTSQG